MKRLFWLCLSLLALLSGCLPRFDGGEPAQPPSGLRPSETQLTPSALISATGEAPLIIEEQGNCPVDEVEIQGEGSRVRGSIGGLAIAPNPIGITPGSARDLGQAIAGIAAPGLERPTALIVVDDFNGDARQPGVYFLDQQGEPMLASLGNGATEAEVAAVEANRQYSHGALVFNHTLALLRAADSEPRVSELSVTVPEEDITLNLPVVVFNTLGVAVIALDTQDFDTTVIAGRLRAVLDTLSAPRIGLTDRVAQQRQGIRRFVVNMSFGMVPCSVLGDIRDVQTQNADLTFEQYVQEVLDTNGLDTNAFRDDLMNLLTTTVGSDPLEALADDEGSFGEGTELVYIAAAGNYRLPFSLFPAYWSEYVAVSAKNLASTVAEKDKDYSNTGEVLLEGGYFTLTGYDQAGGWRDYPNISIAGTSFAAPVLSVFTALDFTSAALRCSRNTGDIASPLAFFKTDPPVALPTPALDVPLVDALERYCLAD